MTINATVTGDREVSQKVRAIGPAVREELGAAMGRITLKLARESVREKLSGQVLKRVTGTLQRGVAQSPRTFWAGDAVVGTVGINPAVKGKGREPVKYGRAHEFGFSGPVTVKQHLRLIKQAFGRKLKSPVAVTVGPFSRQMNLPARSFLRSALNDLNAKGVIKAELQKALNEAIKR